MKNICVLVVIGSVILAACALTGPRLVSPTGFTPFPQLTVTAIKTLPTASSPKDSITWNNLQVTMDPLEVTQEYQTDYGSSRIPTEGNKFLWVHLRIQNIGQTQTDLPATEHFSILYSATELKPTYGHRAAYTDYTTLGPTIFPNQELEGWLRFDIPATSELKDLRFVFLPASSQVGSSYSSPNYPYSDDKPTFVWKCGI